MIKHIFSLISNFIRTGIVGTVELMIWSVVKDNDFYQMLWNTDYIKPGMALGLIAIPLIAALRDYEENEKEINMILKSISR